ncbi:MULTISPECIES: hypothetical protein [unclassified Exiguobacterium]|uniref:hypothetical protein n=1 Tax=unclassified Exiguobacterium TaxID=2644629 RepID=UPI00103E4874|nr:MULTISPECIES: hypothetical protein [unclassified Exiguobacterium]TCI26196.1 hypothetical protein EVJ32_07110 [Exiguobacterium sp. SH5S4]TCI60121.1 hypothetical protein EVJ26_11660 [Exiguobacterium sp. SH3S1]
MFELVRHTQSIAYLFFPASKRMDIHRQLSRCKDGSIETFETTSITSGFGSIQKRLVLQYGDVSSLQVEHHDVTITLSEATLHHWLTGLAVESEHYEDFVVPATHLDETNAKGIEWLIFFRRT